MPNSKNIPKALHRLSARPVIHSENSAKGMLSGSVSMMIKGYEKLSNCAASTMYMKMDASNMASSKIPGGFFQDFHLAGKAVGVAGRQAHFVDGLNGVRRADDRADSPAQRWQKR